MSKPHPPQHDLDKLAANFLAERHRLLAFIHSLVSDRHSSEDILQEVWLRVAAFVNEEGAAIENLPAFCRGVAKNLILHHWRSKFRHRLDVNSELLIFLSRVEGAFDRDESSRELWLERAAALDECVAQLPARSQHLLKAKYQQELTLEEMVPLTGHATTVLKTMLYRLRKALAECVQQRLKPI
jgi:RNA polymerase sigma-70 factor, ECF subfamily